MAVLEYARVKARRWVNPRNEEPGKDDHTFLFEKRDDGRWYVAHVFAAEFWFRETSDRTPYFPHSSLRDNPITPRATDRTGPWLGLAENTLYHYLNGTGQL